VHGQAVGADGGVDVDAAGVHAGEGLTGADAGGEGAGLAAGAGVGSEGDDFVVVVEEELAGQVYGQGVDLVGVVGHEEDGGGEVGQHIAGLAPGGSVWRTFQVGAVHVAAVLAFIEGPWRGDDGCGVYFYGQGSAVAFQHFKVFFHKRSPFFPGRFALFSHYITMGWRQEQKRGIFLHGKIKKMNKNIDLG